MRETVIGPYMTHTPHQSWSRERAAVAALLVAWGFFTGCATPAHQAGVTSGYQPENISSVSSELINVQRVAVLPLACEEARADLPEGRDALNPVLLSELLKTKKFEVVAINRETLRGRMGRADWTGAEVLPAEFFESLRRVHGCDAVLFCQLTAFRAYAPIAIGWRMKLVDTRTGQIVWAVDEVFDAGQPAVLRAARRYELAQLRVPKSDDWGIKNSPRQFGQYAAAEVLARLPGR